MLLEELRQHSRHFLNIFGYIADFSLDFFDLIAKLVHFFPHFIEVVFFFGQKSFQLKRRSREIKKNATHLVSCYSRIPVDPLHKARIPTEEEGIFTSDFHHMFSIVVK